MLFISQESNEVFFGALSTPSCTTTQSTICGSFSLPDAHLPPSSLRYSEDPKQQNFSSWNTKAEVGLIDKGNDKHNANNMRSSDVRQGVSVDYSSAYDGNNSNRRQKELGESKRAQRGK